MNLVKKLLLAPDSSQITSTQRYKRGKKEDCVSLEMSCTTNEGEADREKGQQAHNKDKRRKIETAGEMKGNGWLAS